MSGRPRALVFGDRVTPWRAHLPSTWRVEPLKYHVAINSRTLGEGTPADFEFDYIDIGAVDGLGRIGEVRRHRFETAPSRARRIVRSGDTLISTVRTYLRAITYVGFAEGDLVCSTGFAVLSPGHKLDPRFLGYWMRSDPVVDEIVARSMGVSYPAVAPSEIGSLPIPVLHLVDQRAIADFLDEKTAAIDALIAKKERLIDLIEEKRQAAITRAVTKGLNPDVPRKDSGVEWIGRCPAEWQVAPIKRYTLVRRGASPRPIDDPKYFDENGRYAWVRIADVTASDGRLRTTTQRLSHLGANLSVKLQPGSLFLSIAGSVGKPCITEIDCCIHDGFVYFPNLDRLEPEYMYFIFAAGEAYRGLGKLGTQLNLNTDTVGSIRVPVPPRDEQLSIVRDLRHQLRTQDELRNRISEQIERLREYRQTLISAAVTGQIDVRSRSTRTDEVLQEALA